MTGDRDEAARLIAERMRPFVEPDARFDLDLNWFIPGFAQAEAAAQRLAATERFQAARHLFVTPDNGLAAVRELALRAGKTLVMPTYGLRRGFVRLRGEAIDPAHAKFASWLDGLSTFGEPLPLRAIADGPPLDMIVTAAAAVSRIGQRFGMGGRYLDLEFPILARLGTAGEATPILAVVHDEQCWPHAMPAIGTDICVDEIITPTRIISTGRPPGRNTQVTWELVSGSLAEEPYFAEPDRVDPGGQGARARHLHPAPDIR